MLNVKHDTNKDSETVIEVDDGLLKVELAYIGEGYYGDYDADDKNDAKLLRFYSSVNANYGKNACEANWEELDDGSYCTRIAFDDENDSDEQRKYILEKAMEIHRALRRELKGYPLDGSERIKRVAEQMSYIF